MKTEGKMRGQKNEGTDRTDPLLTEECGDDGCDGCDKVEVCLRAFNYCVVRTTIQLYTAEDDSTSRSELLYMLERKIKGERGWMQFRTFRPENHSFLLETDGGWEQVWEYRVKVRDVFGNETVGKKTAVVHSPAKPTGQPSSP